MERDSSDEEDDREHLIEQNDRKHHQNGVLPTSSPTRRRSTTFDVESRIRQRFNFNKRYSLLAAAIVFLPLFILFLSFSTDIRNLFSTHLKVGDSLSIRMRESELRALYLLRKQQLSLSSLWNSTGNSTLLEKDLNSVSFEDLKSALLKQISLNKEIQQVLLAPHESGNVSSSSSDLDFSNAGGFVQRCEKVDQRFADRKTIEWKPKPNKFLFALCLSGQMSNHLICLEKHMFFAALLNRVLVIPSSRFFCYFSDPTPCYVDEEHVKKLKGLGVSMGKLESPWKEDIKKPSKLTVKDVEGKFVSDDNVIAVGDVFFADVEEEWIMQPGGPIAHKCKTLIEPTRIIMLTAQRFIQTFLGSNFIALHFRRHGFLKFCNAKKPSCFYPVPQAADCIARVVERANAPVVYLSTDAAESETGLLQSLVVVNGRTVPLVTRPSRNSAEKWDALLYRHGLQEDAQVEAMLDKTICAMSSVFIGASGSTFTEDIFRLRKGWESASSCDEYLCQGELPNYIAENE
ncbi:hypothetical protein D5086_006523 [Populus alba]|uniref:Uncharacterized protein n=1 Tax=Populus alba TaxID=43335 RepID=A0ACC4CM16_POPAL